MRFLVTGGAGFIGSHLAERLIQRDDHVTVLDDLSTGSLDNHRGRRDLRLSELDPCAVGDRRRLRVHGHSVSIFDRGKRRALPSIFPAGQEEIDASSGPGNLSVSISAHLLATARAGRLFPGRPALAGHTSRGF